MEVTLLEHLRKALLDQGPLRANAANVWEQVTALDTWGSNAIEGNTLTLPEVETVVIRGISVGDRPMKDVLATTQHGRVFMTLFDRVEDPITVDTARDFHDGVFRGVLGCAGEWRRVSIHIKGTEHRPPPAKEVEGAMAAWEAEYRQRCRDDEPALGMGAWMHHRFEAIHPFEGGNGQVGRLLLDLHLLKHEWPPVHVLPRDREMYIEALEVANGGNLRSLEVFLHIKMARSLLRLMDLLGGGEDTLRPIVELETRGSGFTDYLEHQAEQGELPAIREGNTWLTSQRALQHFNDGNQ